MKLMMGVTFVVYGLVGNELNPAIIFSGLQFFNVLRMPISELPMIFTSLIDASVALQRIGALLSASLRLMILCVVDLYRLAS
jgi:hypothetical protein